METLNNSDQLFIIVRSSAQDCSHKFSPPNFVKTRLVNHIAGTLDELVRVNTRNVYPCTGLDPVLYLCVENVENVENVTLILSKIG